MSRKRLSSLSPVVQRRHRAIVAMDAYRKACAATEMDLSQSSDAELASVLSDLMHLAKSLKVDFNRALTRAERYFADEVIGDVLDGKFDVAAGVPSHKSGKSR